MPHSRRRSKDCDLHTSTPASRGLGLKTVFGLFTSATTNKPLVRRFQTHLPVEPSSHGDDVPCLAVNGEHVLRGALRGLRDDAVPHHPVGRGAVVRVVRRHRHHVGPWEGGKRNYQCHLTAEQTAVPVTRGHALCSEMLWKTISLQSSQARRGSWK